MTDDIRLARVTHSSSARWHILHPEEMIPECHMHMSDSLIRRDQSTNLWITGDGNTETWELDVNDPRTYPPPMTMCYECWHSKLKYKALRALIKKEHERRDAN